MGNNRDGDGDEDGGGDGGGEQGSRDEQRPSADDKTVQQMNTEPEEDLLVWGTRVPVYTTLFKLNIN